MSQVVTVFKNVSWVTISQVVTNVCAFIWTILIARYLGVTDYGILSFVISLVMLIGIGEDIGTTTYSIREISRERDLTTKFLRNVLPLKWLLSIILFIATILALKSIGYNNLTIKITFIMFLETIFMSFCNFLSGVSYLRLYRSNRGSALGYSLAYAGFK